MTMWYIHTKEYYSARKKEWNNAIFSNTDGSMDYHTEWSKSEREKQISYINACMWNLERWYWWTSSQGSEGDTDVEDRLVDTAGGEGGMNEESMETYTLPYGKQTARGNLLHDSGGCDNLERWDRRWERGSRGRGHMYTCDWFMLMYGRNQHNIVKQLSFN